MPRDHQINEERLGVLRGELRVMRGRLDELRAERDDLAVRLDRLLGHLVRRRVMTRDAAVLVLRDAGVLFPADEL